MNSIWEKFGILDKVTSDGPEKYLESLIPFNHFFRESLFDGGFEFCGGVASSVLVVVWREDQDVETREGTPDDSELESSSLSGFLFSLKSLTEPVEVAWVVFKTEKLHLRFEAITQSASDAFV